MLVPPESKDYLSALMIANGFQLNVVTDDLQRYATEDEVFLLPKLHKFSVLHRITSHIVTFQCIDIRKPSDLTVAER